MFRLMVVLFLSLSISSSLLAENFDWPVWRGPDGNSISKEKNWNPKALQNIKYVWKKDLGIGYAQPHGALFSPRPIVGIDWQAGWHQYTAQRHGRLPHWMQEFAQRFSFQWPT